MRLRPDSVLRRGQRDVLIVSPKAKQTASIIALRLPSHNQRHTCKSLMANVGVSNSMRIKIRGHRALSMNQRYPHLEAVTIATAAGQDDPRCLG